LKACIGPDDLVARLGGDEFVILLTHIRAEAEAIQLADRLHQAVRQRVNLGEQKIFPTVSIGIIYDQGYYELAENLLRDADVALYEAKAGGRAQYRTFDMAQRTQAMARLRLEADLWEAIDRHEFQIYYQPIVSLARSDLVGVEAVLRWQHPGRGLLKPGEFIDVAEETGLITTLGDWLLRSACLQVKRWQAAGLAALRLAVKVSVHPLEQGLLLSRVETALEETGLAPAVLELELTERITPLQFTTCLPTLQALKALGVRLSAANFGAGMSMSLLRQFEFDTLKIDRSFITAMRPDNAVMVRAIIVMAHRLGLKVVADGVETEAQRVALRAQRCDEIQGSLISPPLPAAEFIQLIEKEPS
jgi:EAL domain-containing protein (putative c-di-GMP-specific phosphodiesterase class I)